jgi:hypothetical protein
MENSEDLSMRQKMQSWDLAIKSGQAGLVRKDLSLLKNESIARPLVCDMADLARRVQMPFLVMRWLKPYVRPDTKILSESTTQERALYAAALMRVGATNEANFILQSVSEKNNSFVLLFQSHLEVLHWNYGRSIPFLKAYLKTIDPNSYASIVGRLNLCAAYVSELDWLRAEPALKELLAIADEKKYKLIYSNVLELSAQVAIHRFDFTQAEQFLDQAMSHLQSTGGKDDLFIKKWQMVIQILRNDQPSDENLIKQKAFEFKNWETVRELDFYKALALRDSELYLHVLFGTQFMSYRKQMQRIFKPDFSIPESHIWSFGFPVDQHTPWIDLKSGVTSIREVDLSSQPLLFAALKALAKDFYRPFRVGQLMQDIYPNEYFDPVSSPQRLFQTLRRLRLWLKKNKFPLKVVLHQGQFSLEAERPVYIKVYRRKSSEAQVETSLRLFLEVWHNKAFTSKDFQKHYNLQERKAQRSLAQAVKNKVLQRVQVGKKIIYKKN